MRKLNIPKNIKFAQSSTMAAALVLTSLAISGCGGGEEQAANLSTQASGESLLISASSEIVGQKIKSDHPDDLRKDEPVLSEGVSAQMEAIELAAQALITPKPADSTEVMKLKTGTENVAIFTVGMASFSMGPAGKLLTQRNGTKSIEIVKLDQQKSGALPDVVYVRAGDINVKDFENSVLFKNIRAQDKSILVEREASGDTAYRTLLSTLFGGDPGTSNAIMIRPTGTESYSFYFIEPEEEIQDDEDTNNDGDSEGSLETLKSNSTKPIIDLSKVAAVAKPTQYAGIGDGVDMNDLDSTNDFNDGESSIKATRQRLPNTVMATYQIGRQYAPSLAQSFIINPITWKWETPVASCKKGSCAAYNNTKVTYNNWKPVFVNAVWWDDWFVCGGVKNNGNFCQTDYTISKKKITGVDQSVTAEAGVSVEVSGGASFFGFAELKTSTTVSAKAGYGKTWKKSTENTYQARYLARVNEGFRGRFGRGNYTMHVSRWFTGRHENVNDMSFLNDNFYKSAEATGTTTNISAADEQKSFACVAYWSNRENYQNHVWFWKASCPSTWDASYKQRTDVIGLKNYGVKVWAICKNTDTTCVKNYESGTAATRSKLFPL